MLETIVLLVHADDILELNWCSLCICAVAIEILDVSETVTAETQLVGCDTEANIADVEGLLAVVRGAGV
jgi:hypothetical protein